jgi:hypothetical protein
MSQRGALPQKKSDCAYFFFLSTAADMIEIAAGADQERHYWEIIASHPDTGVVDVLGSLEDEQ